jgi:hypothetical protein
MRRAAAGLISLAAAGLLIACADEATDPQKRIGKATEQLALSREAGADRVSDPNEEVLAAALPFLAESAWLVDHPVLSPNAKVEIHHMALAEAEAEPHPGDGAGRAWVQTVEAVDFGAEASPKPTWQRLHAPPPGMEPAPPPFPSLSAGSRHRFRVHFEVGPPGLSSGGRLFLQAEPFWEWSEAQTLDPTRDGYTTARLLDASPTVDGGGPRIERDPETGGFRVEGGEIEPGRRIEFVYGAGPSGARVDRYEDRQARILIATDADGDGYRRWVGNSARVDVIAGPGRLLLAQGPAEILPGEAFEVVVALVDRDGNRATWPGLGPDGTARTGPSTEEKPDLEFEIEILPESSLRVVGDPFQRSVPDRPNGSVHLALSPSPGEGVLRLRVRGRGALEGAIADAPPIVVRRDAETRLVWADLHGHSGLSDGTGTPADYLEYAETTARLDVVALTDHDHWGIEPLDEDPERVQALFEQIDRAERPGRFVTVPGYEWTSWLHGHRHVLYFDAPLSDPASRPLFSSIDPSTDRPDELWAALGDRPALTFAHHSAGEPVAVNWIFPPDPVLEPVTEVVSVHGQSESPEVDFAVRGGIPGNFVSDVLRRGDRLGFIGSGDSHDGHPGLAQIASHQGGLAGLFVERLDRSAVLAALRARRSFATNGIRPWLRVELDGAMMGSAIAAPPPGRDQQTLRIRYFATAPLEAIEIVRSGRTARIAIDPEQAWALDLERRIPALAPGEYHYVRFFERDGGQAWSSPIFVDRPAVATP